MENPIGSIPNLAIAVQLLIWSVGWLTAATVGLWKAQAAYWRGFWLVVGVWCAVNSIIALSGLLGPLADLDHLKRILLINAGLDVLYVAAGVFMLSRSSAAVRGAGLAVLIQAVFLLIFDAAHAQFLPPA